MGKSRHLLKRISFWALLFSVGCASTGPITGNRMADLAVRADDVTYVIVRQRDHLRYGNYLIVERFPDLSVLRPGLPSRVAFQQLGKATGVEVGLSSFPSAEVAMKAPQDVVVEWRTTAYWALALRHPGNLIETADIAVSFVKITRTKEEIPFVGSPYFPALDQGWFIEQVNLLPQLHNLKSKKTSTPAKPR